MIYYIYIIYYNYNKMNHFTVKKVLNFLDINNDETLIQKLILIQQNNKKIKSQK